MIFIFVGVSTPFERVKIGPCYMLQNISCNTLKFATFISLNHFMGEFSYIRRYLLPGDGGWGGGDTGVVG